MRGRRGSCCSQRVPVGEPKLLLMVGLPLPGRAASTWSLMAMVVRLPLLCLAWTLVVGAPAGQGGEGTLGYEAGGLDAVGEGGEGKGGSLTALATLNWTAVGNVGSRAALAVDRVRGFAFTCATDAGGLTTLRRYPVPMWSVNHTALLGGRPSYTTEMKPDMSFVLEGFLYVRSILLHNGSAILTGEEVVSATSDPSLNESDSSSFMPPHPRAWHPPSVRSRIVRVPGVLAPPPSIPATVPVLLSTAASSMTTLNVDQPTGEAEAEDEDEQAELDKLSPRPRTPHGEYRAAAVAATGVIDGWNRVGRLAKERDYHDIRTRLTYVLDRSQVDEVKGSPSFLPPSPLPPSLYRKSCSTL